MNVNIFSLLYFTSSFYRLGLVSNVFPILHNFFLVFTLMSHIAKVVSLYFQLYFAGKSKCLRFCLIASYHFALHIKYVRVKTQDWKNFLLIHSKTSVFHSTSPKYYVGHCHVWYSNKKRFVHLQTFIFFAWVN